MEAVRMMLVVACFLGINLFQMDIKTAFLNGKINEEIYVSQPKGFESHEFPDHVHRVKRALYGLKQAPRAWYKRLSNYLIQHGYIRGTVDKTLFVRQENN